MSKYLLMWELDTTKVPIDRKERGGGFELLMAMVKQDIEKGLIKDWGAFVGEINGYCIVEGTEVDVGNMIHQYVPFVFFETSPVANIEQVEEIVRALSQ
jgi:hypothetical protein